MRRPRPKFKNYFYLYFCCFWINVTQINFENIKRKIQRIIYDSCFHLKSRFNVDARAPSMSLSHYWTSPLILPSQFWQIRFESYTDCTVQSAEYWCFYALPKKYFDKDSLEVNGIMEPTFRKKGSSSNEIIHFKVKGPREEIQIVLPCNPLQTMQVYSSLL